MVFPSVLPLLRLHSPQHASGSEFLAAMGSYEKYKTSGICWLVVWPLYAGVFFMSTTCLSDMEVSEAAEGSFTGDCSLE